MRVTNGSGQGSNPIRHIERLTTHAHALNREGTMTNANPPGWPPQGQPGFAAAPIQQARKQRGRGLKIVGLIAYGIVVLIIGIAIGSAGKPAAPAAASTKSTTPSTTTQNTPAPTATTPAAAAPANQVLIRFAGSGIKNSAPFSVGSGPLTITYRFDSRISARAATSRPTWSTATSRVSTATTR